MRNILVGLLIKSVMCSAVLWIVLGVFYGVELDDILTTSIILTGFSYVIGDLVILPRFENMSATISDFFLSFLVVLAIGSLLYEGPISLITASLVSALVLSLGELIFFHQYMNKNVLPGEHRNSKDRIGGSPRRLQTELSEELDPDDRHER